jgi:hypothetical protein
MRRIALLLLSSALALGSACSQPRSGTTAPRSSSDVITAQDIRATSFTNVYDVIAQLRFRWLQARGTDTVNLQPGNVMVRLDDNELGTVQALRNLSPSGITSIHFVDPVSAGGRWGLGYAHGAIVISTRVELAH